MILTSFLLLFIVDGIIAKNCDNECYRNVENKLTNLTNSFEKPNKILSLLERYNTIKNFTRTVQEITAIIKVEESEIVKNLDNLKRKTLLHEETIDTCNETKDLYTNLTAIVGKISKGVNKLNESKVNLTERMNKSKERSLQIKKDLDFLKIPTFIGNNYMCNTSLGETVQKIIASGQRITESFNVLKDKQFDSLKKKQAELKALIDVITNLDKNFEDPSLKINDETEPLLKEISKKIEDLQNRLKNIKFSSKPLDISKLTLKNDELLEEFKKILELVFSKENLKKVRKEIKRGRELIDIIKMKLELKKEFEDIRKVVSHLQSTKACQLIDAHFEP